MRRTRLSSMSPEMKMAQTAYKLLRTLLGKFLFRCARCSTRCDHLDWHHPFKRGKGKMLWKMLCVIPLCRACHDWVHANENQAREDGWLVKPKPTSPWERH